MSKCVKERLKLALEQKAKQQPYHSPDGSTSYHVSTIHLSFQLNSYVQYILKSKFPQFQGLLCITLLVYTQA